MQLADGSFEVIRKQLTVDVPTIDSEDAAGGEAITFKQFKQVIEATPLVVEGPRAKGFTDLLWGFWYSGFRLGETIKLSWDDRKTIHIEDIDDSVSYIVFPRGQQKAKRFERWVLPPDLQEHLRNLPGLQTGFVYKPLTLKLERCGGREELSRTC